VPTEISARDIFFIPAKDGIFDQHPATSISPLQAMKVL